MRKFINSKIEAARLKDLNDDLLSAAYKGDLAKVIELLNKGAEIDYVHDGKTALINAIRGQKENVVSCLLQLGASAEARPGKDSEGGIDPAITVAAMTGNEKIVKILLDAGVSRESTTRHKMIRIRGVRHSYQSLYSRLGPLQIAVLDQNEKVVRTLLNGGVDIDGGNHTALMIAACGRDKKMVKILLALGANVNATTSSGRNAIHFYYNGLPIPDFDAPPDPEIIFMLLEAGINAGDASKLIPKQMKRIAIMQDMFPDLLDENGRLKPEVEDFGKDQWDIILPYFSEALSMPDDLIKIVVQYLGLRELVAKIRPLINPINPTNPTSIFSEIFKKDPVLDPVLDDVMKKMMQRDSSLEKAIKSSGSYLKKIDNEVAPFGLGLRLREDEDEKEGKAELPSVRMPLAQKDQDPLAQKDQDIDTLGHVGDLSEIFKEDWTLRKIEKALMLGNPFAEPEAVRSGDDGLKKIIKESEQKADDDFNSDLGVAKKASLETSNLKLSEPNRAVSESLSKSNSFKDKTKSAVTNPVVTALKKASLQEIARKG